MGSRDGTKTTCTKWVTAVILVAVLALIQWNDGLVMLENNVALNNTSTRRSINNSTVVAVVNDSTTSKHVQGMTVIDTGKSKQEDILLKSNDAMTNREDNVNETGASVIPMILQDDDDNDAVNDDKDHHWRGDNLLDIKNIARLAKTAMIAQMKQDYGEDNFANIFLEQNGKPRQAFVPAGTKSAKRFKRKLKIKILNSANNTTQQQYMVWATGGHSGAAGHGNLFNQSYTAFMQKAVSTVFSSIGIEFEARNHAMGGTSSGPEIALCQEAVFGTDIDVLSWDYGMVDGSWKGGEAMYQQRAGSHPVLVDINVASRKTRLEQQFGLLQRAEERGQASFYLKPDEFQDMKEGIPDTFGLSDEQISVMPRMVRYFKCQGGIEKGEPGCDRNKFTNRDGDCKGRKGMAKWHPGWKMQALYGNAMALFLSDVLLEAIDELSSAATSNRTELLARLMKEEEDDRSLFSPPAPPHPIEYDNVPLDKDLLLNEANISVFFRSSSICHTARLPSMTRYLGILTESNETGVHDYYKGIHIKQAIELVSQGNNSDMPMPLVWDNGDRDTTCPLELQRDHKDYFFVSSRMGSTTLTVPNAAELQAYGRESERLHGILVLCLVRCPWRKCPKGAMRQDAIRNGQVRLEVNDQLVTNVTDFGGECLVLRNENGHRFQPNDAGQFVLRAKVLGNNSILRISSLIVF